MTNLLEITGGDIALLNDTDLRILIGLLCEADFRLAGLPTKGIIWGGHQDAPDDGLDVTVRSEISPPQNSFVPRKVTGFQVKKPDMPRAKILAEMRPQGELKETIKALIHQVGAYVMVSSSGSTTEAALRHRVNAMKEAVASEPDHEQLQLEFFDRGLVANWVRSHPSLILWVRNKIGRPLQGWKPYDNWANTPKGVEEEYLIDDELRLHDGVSSDTGIPIIEGIRALRTCLSSGASIRLTGLSGVGKTRLVQALFDDRLGEHPLSPSLAYYTDISNSPNPDPVAFADQLLQANTKAILIVDNCSQELHRQLTKVCVNSPVSLLTVEYDIRDDLPEETDVFRLEPSSDDLIEKLLLKRFNPISQINARTIAEFAGGNARVALALANTLRRDENLSTLRDEELFERLFHQRHDPNDDLQASAEICSLVYSFNGIDTTTPASELNFLARLANKSTRELYRNIEELRARRLAQARSDWRAVLPHAIANRLAKRALCSIPMPELVDAFLSCQSERLLQSFSRRLGYLHDCAEAVQIAGDWLKPDGWIGVTNCNFNYLELRVFENIAPISPGLTLEMLERAANNDGERLFASASSEFIRLLQHIAYEPEFFQRSVRLLCEYALKEDPALNTGNAARNTLQTLFHIVLSGTHALLQMRAAMVNELLDSDALDKQELGIGLLKAALETDHFHNTNISNFGARSRDYGYQPNSTKDISDWYATFIKICTRIALSDEPTAPKARKVLADAMRGLWAVGANNQDFLTVLEDSINQIHAKQAWNGGWLALKGAVRYEGQSMQVEVLDRLKQIEAQLKPTNLLERARTYALTDRWSFFALEDDYDEAGDRDGSFQWQQVEQTTREIGAEAAQDEVVLKVLLPELVSPMTPDHRLMIFGEGLADGCVNKHEIWQLLYAQFEKTPSKGRDSAVLLGFLSSCAEHDPDFYDATMDSLIEDSLLGQWFPIFQITSKLDTQGVARLHKALDNDKVDVTTFLGLAYGRHREAIDDDDLAELIQKLLAKEGGVKVAIKVLQMRFHKSKNEVVKYSPRLLGIAREAISKYPFDQAERRGYQHNMGFSLAQVAYACLSGQDGLELTTGICQLLAEGFQDYRFSPYDYPYLLKCLAQIHPYTFLDIFMGDEQIGLHLTRLDGSHRRDNPINQVPESTLISWCDQAPDIRYSRLVSSLQTYTQTKGSEQLEWKPLIYTILEKVPDVHAVLSNLARAIHSLSRSGSQATALEKRSTLYTSLYKHPNLEVRDWAEKGYEQLQLSVQKLRESELRESQQRFERFE